MRRKNSDGEKIEIIDLARGFAILTVWMFHFGIAHITDPAGPVLLQWVWRRFWVHGAYGVQIFFVVSGYLITRLIATRAGGLFKPDLGKFYARRAGRILPLLFLSLLFGAGALLYPFGSAGHADLCLKNPSASFGPAFWASILTFSFNWYRVFLAGPVKDFGLHWDLLWTLSIEEQFYLFYPLFLLWLGKERKLLWFLAFVIVLGTITRAAGVAFFSEQAYWNEVSFAEFDLIAIGCLLYLTARRFGPSLKKNKGACLFLLGAGIFMVLKVFWEATTELDYTGRIFGPFLLGFGVFLLLLGGLHLKTLQHPFFKLLALPGRLSYGGYLIHPAMLFFLWPLLGGKNEWLAFGIFALATMGVAGLSYVFYETPMNRMIRKYWGA